MIFALPVNGPPIIRLGSKCDLLSVSPDSEEDGNTDATAAPHYREIPVVADRGLDFRCLADPQGSRLRRDEFIADFNIGGHPACVQESAFNCGFAFLIRSHLTPAEVCDILGVLTVGPSNQRAAIWGGPVSRA